MINVVIRHLISQHKGINDYLITLYITYLVIYDLLKKNPLSDLYDICTANIS